MWVINNIAPKYYFQPAENLLLSGASLKDRW
jgi:hypothetical protein